MAVVDAPGAVDADDVVEVADAEHHVAAGLGPFGLDAAELVDDRVGVETGGVGAVDELDQRVAEHVHALLEHARRGARHLQVLGHG